MSIDFLLMCPHTGKPPHAELTPIDLEVAATLSNPTLSQNNLDLAITYVTRATNTTSQTTYTFSSQSIGAAPTGSESRWIVVAVAAWSTDIFNAASISGVTVGGVSAHEIVNQNDANSDAAAAIYVISVGAGTTADVVVTGLNCDSCGISIFRVIALDSQDYTSSANYSSRSDTWRQGVSDGRLSNFPFTDGVFVGLNVQDATANGTTTWTGVTHTEEFDETVTNGGAWSAIFGDSPTSSATIDVDSSNGSAEGVLIMAQLKRD